MLSFPRWFAGVLRHRLRRRLRPARDRPTLALIMAMTGRAAYCDELTGAGVAVLRGRC